MTLLCEDGSGVAGAESYARAADLVTYCAAFGYTAPPVGVQEAFLRRACSAMERMAWAGERTAPGDALAWPRTGVRRRDRPAYDPALPDNVIPDDIKNGQMRLAVELYGIDQAPTVEAGASGRLTGITETVSGAVSRSKTFDNTGRSGAPSPTAVSDSLFAPYLSGGGAFGVIFARRA